MDTSHLAIWWMTESDANVVLVTRSAVTRLPKYVTEELHNLQTSFGFNIRKLWVPRILGTSVSLPQRPDSGIYRIFIQASIQIGAIVFLKADLPSLPGDIGMVTDFDWNILPQGEPSPRGEWDPQRAHAARRAAAGCVLLSPPLPSMKKLSFVI